MSQNICLCLLSSLPILPLTCFLVCQGRLLWDWDLLFSNSDTLKMFLVLLWNLYLI